MNTETIVDKITTTNVIELDVDFMKYNKTKRTLEPSKASCQLIIITTNKSILQGWETNDVISVSRFKTKLVKNREFLTLEQLSAFLSRMEMDKYFENVKELNQKHLYYNTIRNWYQDKVSQVGFSRPCSTYGTAENPPRTAPVITSYSKLIELFYAESKKGNFVTKAFVPDRLMLEYVIGLGIKVGRFSPPSAINRRDGSFFRYNYSPSLLTEEEKNLMEKGEAMFHFSWLDLDFNISEAEFFQFHYS